MTTCPDESEVLEFVEGRPTAVAAERMQQHLDECAPCREWVANVADALLSATESRTERSDDGDASIEQRLRGALVGRYTVLAREGAGGMGAVYSAYDPQLDRKIALKLVRTDRWMRGDRAAVRAQLLHEAQAMARLNHANVISIYDVGTVGDELFIAMEFVEGNTLGGWVRARSRNWREILARYLLAGDGLAAAHRAGLVHRDFKPDNVLVGDDGRVRVSDFGLASTPAIADPSQSSPAGGHRNPSRTSAAIGTPAYMAPEQRAGEGVDARADQYSFCRALEQALFEQAPTGAPAWLLVPLRRGQQRDRSLRFATMEALLASLRRDPARTRRRAVSAAGIAALATVAVIGASGWLRAGATATCAASDTALAGVWDESVREQVAEGFRESTRRSARENGARVEAKLSSWAADWTAMHKEVCEATRVREEQSEALFDLRMQCLDRRRGRLSALTHVLAQQRPAPIDEAIPAIDGLPKVDDCADVEQLTAAVPLPSDVETRAAIDAASTQLDRLVSEQYLLGHDPSALASTQALVDRVHGLDYPPLEMRALGVLADLQDTAGDHAASEATLLRALAAAAAARDDRGHGLTLIKLVAVMGVGQRRFAEAEAAGRITESVLSRARSPDEDLAGLHSVRGQIARLQGQLARARSEQELALALIDAAPGASVAARAAERSNLAATLGDLGEHGLALERLDEARAMLEEELGPEHPVLATVMMNIGTEHAEAHRPAAARDADLAAIAIWEQAYGPDYVMVGDCLDNLALAEQQLGNLPRARAHEERAIALLERSLGPDHPEVGDARGNLGDILCELREHDAGIAQYERSLAIGEAALGSEHPDLGYPLTGLGECRLDRGDAAAAVPLLERALRLRAQAEGESAGRLASETRTVLERARASAPPAR